MKYVLLCLVLFLLAGCFAPPYLYYGNSSYSYYKKVKKQDAKAVENYKHSLEQVFSRSEKSGRPVPPGLYCDYALLMLEEQQNELAVKYFNLEKQTWSESGSFMDFLMQRYGLKR